MAYDSELPGCFGGNDHQFALHPLDEKRAFDWLVALRGRQALWVEAKEQIQDYLRKQGVVDVLISVQVSRARKMLGPWLLGPVGDDEP